MFYRYRDRLPLQDLKWEFKKEDFFHQNKKIITKDQLSTGFYMLEVGIHAKNFNSQLKFDFKTRTADKNKTNSIFELTVRADRICKRLIFLNYDAFLETDLMHEIEFNSLYHLRIARLTKSFFLSRLLTKIGLKSEVRKIDQLSEKDIALLWERYNLLFSQHRNQKNSYEYFIKNIEPNLIPSDSEQMRIAQTWKRR
jgi:hypothetical protein